MGRKRKYQTKEEKLEAQRKWQMEHYHRNKEEILQKAKDTYKRKKREKQRRDRVKKMYGDQ
jgi:hypothetical protein|tara:strand:+ start:742 stop:924 length:183 start_codon:yes stop_codon:yes gene_type:complete